MPLEEGGLRLDRGDSSSNGVHDAQSEVPQPPRRIRKIPGRQQGLMRVDAHAQRAMGIHGLGKRSAEGRSTSNALSALRRRPACRRSGSTHSRTSRFAAPCNRAILSVPCS